MLKNFDTPPSANNAPLSSAHKTNSTLGSVETVMKEYECHCCCLSLPEKSIVKCLNQDCPLYFCRPCLIRFNKYSRKNTKRLPSPAWKCPCCAHKCKCSR